MTLHGEVKKGVVVFQGGDAGVLPEGTLVTVIPVADSISGTPSEPAARNAGPPYHVSKEQREALLGLIGMWKMEHPPNDEEVERIIEEERTKKYG